MLPGFLPEQRHKITKLFAERKRKTDTERRKSMKTTISERNSYISIVIYTENGHNYKITPHNRNITQDNRNITER